MLTRVAEKLPGASERGRGIYGCEVYACICVGEKIGAPEKEQKYFSKHHFQSTICLCPWNLQQ